MNVHSPVIDHERVDLKRFIATHPELVTDMMCNSLLVKYQRICETANQLVTVLKQCNKDEL